MRTFVVFVLMVHRALAVAPVFTKPNPDTSAADHQIDLKETAEGGDAFYTLVATDTDTEDSSLTFAIDDASEQDTKDLFEITDGNKLTVNDSVTAGTFNFEDANAKLKYNIVLTVFDGVDTTFLSTQICLVDINEFDPEFQGTPYNKTVLESSPADTSVFKVMATDADAADQITYSTSGDNTNFVINATTGIISVAANADFIASSQEYYVTVIAVDNGIPPRPAVETVTFTIIAEPMFTNLVNPLTVRIDENSGKGSSVLTATVSDKDTPSENLNITIKSQAPGEMFEMEGDVLKTKDSLDAETQQTYTVTLEVTDGMNSAMSAPITVIVNDLNDNQPAIESVSPVTIPENKDVGPTSEVVDINASDADVDSVLAYSITSGNTDDIFGINTANGKIYLAKGPKSMTVNKFNLTVSVTDGTFTEAADVMIIFDTSTINECSNNPCQNSGVCTSFLNDHACQCTTGFSGTNCVTNINECTATSCKNGGTCRDGVNTFTCLCTTGYIGLTCEQACTNNKFGDGCGSNCVCNVSRLIENISTQQCNHVSGACTCNGKWTGKFCESDVNECTNLTICSAISNQVCVNTDGGYYCTCKQGYRQRSDIDRSCVISPFVATVRPGAGESAVTVSITLDKPCVPAELQEPLKYAALKAMIESMLLRKLTTAKRVEAFSIRCGSVLFDSTIITDDTDAARTQLASDLQDLRNGDIVAIDGVNTKATAITVNGNTLPLTSGTSNTGTKVCQVYVTLTTCPTGQTCQYVDGTASCRTIPKDEDDDTDLILGLGLGIGLPLILLVIILVAVFFWKQNRRWYKHDNRRRYGNRSIRDSYAMDWKDDHRRSYEHPQYLDKREFYGLHADNYRY